MDGCKLDGHGFEAAVFVKLSRGNRQTIKIMQDGCIITVLETLQNAPGAMHTGAEHKDSPAYRQQLLESGFEEDI